MKTLSRLFISPDERRLRSGWRLILQFVLMMVLGLLFVPIIMIAAGLLPGIGLLDAGGELSQESGAGMLAGQAINLLGITVSVYLARRFLDRRSFRSLGLERTGRRGTRPALRLRACGADDGPHLCGGVGARLAALRGHGVAIAGCRLRAGQTCCSGWRSS